MYSGVVRNDLPMIIIISDLSDLPHGIWSLIRYCDSFSHSLIYVIDSPERGAFQAKTKNMYILTKKVSMNWQIANKVKKKQVKWKKTGKKEHIF